MEGKEESRGRESEREREPEMAGTTGREMLQLPAEGEWARCVCVWRREG